MKHFVIVGVLVVVVAVLVNAGLNAIGLMPVQASAQAVPIDNLFNLHVTAISFLFALIVVFLVYSVIVFRRKPGDLSDGAHIEGHSTLELLWTVAPLITVIAFSALGAQALAETRRIDPQALEVRVVGFQWSWRFEYPEYGITSDTLGLPVNRQALLKLTSEDVLHSFWVPEFRVKQDALPGAALVKELRITPTLLGDYKVRCAELCGRQHAYMESAVLVLEDAAFDEWVAAQAVNSTDPVVRGAKWAKDYGCVKCHSTDGSALVGPSWQGALGRQESLSDGSTVVVDEAYLLESIVDPRAKIVRGYPDDQMPDDLAQKLTPDQIQDLVAYIISLK